jgi:hypothetical protein
MHRDSFGQTRNTGVGQGDDHTTPILSRVRSTY